ncbi:hypothetical protein WDA79_07725 [Streptomyces sp. A475]|uniref:hypothetical protein n=1 Tax=Streptomyces sp. A475 TaxID=3131976 RepID=UPI0030C9F4C5
MFTRSVGMGLVIVGIARFQARDLELGLELGLKLGNRSVDILARAQPSRGLRP